MTVLSAEGETARERHRPDGAGPPIAVYVPTLQCRRRLCSGEHRAVRPKKRGPSSPSPANDTPAAAQKKINPRAPETKPRIAIAGTNSKITAEIKIRSSNRWLQNQTRTRRSSRAGGGGKRTTGLDPCPVSRLRLPRAHAATGGSVPAAAARRRCGDAGSPPTASSLCSICLTASCRFRNLYGKGGKDQGGAASSQDGERGRETNGGPYPMQSHVLSELLFRLIYSHRIPLLFSPWSSRPKEEV
ncbi:uncharacterized protein LOC120687522 [Panicum virgatum]|uniref:uncharacterized protein LOC120687522 n=1 Tax=Panicum virgatum TaxID=38727 RepID=UPI0019D51236|nr:uncharacterized protein LOC120687522 [Panicum virgatum]